MGGGGGNSVLGALVPAFPGTQFDVLGGGKKSAPVDNFEAQQAAQEAKRQKARDALNLMFGVAPSDAIAGQSTEAATNKAGRDALYQKVRDDAFTAGKRRFDENKDRAALDNKFALFAQGLNGGSVDVDQSALLNRTYGQGLLDLGAKADATKTDMLSNDETTRLGLLQSIDNGTDQGSAISSALNQMKANTDRAASQAQGTTLGDLFGDAGLLYSKSNAARGRQDAQAWWQQQYPGSMSAPRGARTGIITPTGG